MPPKTLFEVDAIVEKLFAQMSLREKISLLSGRDNWATMPVERLGIPAMVMTDGPHGVRANQPDSGRTASGPTTAFPTGISMASSWDPELVSQVGRALGEETKAMGCDILLGPCVNIIRTPIAGRNFESYSEDPYLAGRIGVAYVNGVQSAGVGTSLKHYAANNQEIERGRGSSEVDERTLREIYLAQFEAIVKEAQPWTVMCSYNRINGVYASQNHHTLTEILKDEWGFEGLVVSDWGANHTTTESVKGGLDLEMPGPAKWYGRLLEEAVQSWQIEEEDVDRAARRVLRILVRTGKLDGTETTGSVNTPEHQALARKLAEDAIVLLKNEGGILPLKPESLQHVAVIGPAAGDIAVSGGGSAYVVPPHKVMPITALRERVGQQVEIGYEQGADNYLELPVLNSMYLKPARGSGLGLYGEYFRGDGFEGKPVMERVDARMDFWWFSAGPTDDLGPSFSARWAGRLEVPTGGRYTLRVGNTGTLRVFVDGQQVIESSGDGSHFYDFGSGEAILNLEAGRSYDLRLELRSVAQSAFTHIKVTMGQTPEVDTRIAQAVELAKSADVALVYVGDTEQFETEGWDRPNLRLPGRQDELVDAVASANPNTVVVLNVGAPVEMPWLDKVTAVVLAYFPGMEGGQAITSVLTGAVNPSGKLTATWPRRFEDTPSFHNLSIPEARLVLYGEGIFVGYRYYDKSAVQPLFPFGHGLSYTQFAYSNLRVPAAVKDGETFEVSLDVSNTGSLAGQEVVQLYVRDVQSTVNRPVKELKGFRKVALRPGETQTLTFTLDRRALAYYDVIKKDWVVESGAFEILAGASAADIRLTAGFTVE